MSDKFRFMGCGFMQSNILKFTWNISSYSGIHNNFSTLSGIFTLDEVN